MIFIAQWQALLWFSSALWEHFSLVQDFGRATRNMKLPGQEEEGRDIFPRQENVWKGVLRVTMEALNWQVARAGPPRAWSGSWGTSRTKEEPGPGSAGWGDQPEFLKGSRNLVCGTV